MQCTACYDGGACLPGGCGVAGCTACGKPCSRCLGTCEIEGDELEDIEPEFVSLDDVQIDEDCNVYFERDDA